MPFIGEQMKNSNFDINYQNLADIWVKEQLRKFKKYFSVAQLKTHRLQRNLRERDWSKDKNNVETVFFANKAIIHGASRELPFKTLVLLGRFSMDKKVSHEIREIIKANVIKSDGLFYKLDDLENQVLIRKFLKTKNYNILAKKQKAA
jgi:hypothetical protein